MFIIRKEFLGKTVSKVEDRNPKKAMEYLARQLVEISMDSRFSIHISVALVPMHLQEMEKELVEADKPIDPSHWLV